MEQSVVQHGAALLACAAADERAEAALKAATRAPPMQKEALNAAAAAARDTAADCRLRFQKSVLPPLLKWATGRSKLHSLLSARDGRVIAQEHEREPAAPSLAETQRDSLRALLHPELGSSPHLAPFSFCENSADPSFLAEAPNSWILAMSGAVAGEHLQRVHDELLAQWGKFSDEALQSPIPKKVGLSDLPAAQSWSDRVATLRESCGASVVPKPDALTVHEHDADTISHNDFHAMLHAGHLLGGGCALLPAGAAPQRGNRHRFRVFAHLFNRHCKPGCWARYLPAFPKIQGPNQF